MNTGYPLLLTGVLLNAAAQLLLKAGTRAIGRFEFAAASYPLLSLGYVINAIGAWYLFGESMTFARIAGIGLIVAGVALVARTAQGA